MARQEGFEPPTYCLEGSCSILLSYWRMILIYYKAFGAAGGSRTHILIKEQPSEDCVYTNFTTAAFLFYGADERSRTSTPFGTRPSTVPVYQFQHIRILLLYYTQSNTYFTGFVLYNRPNLSAANTAIAWLHIKGFTPTQSLCPFEKICSGRK
jgi:hypothetical protein